MVIVPLGTVLVQVQVGRSHYYTGKEGPQRRPSDGKRYSKEEDEIVINAVAEYVESHNLGDEGLKTVLNCGAHQEVRKCWKEIQAAFLGGQLGEYTIELMFFSEGIRNIHGLLKS
ncbi:hypothetical protein J1N35_045950 [Gossypium stocksii]|uniref:Uncharacterized protein n=1 Tax=Gossypium stocksii TaxID=47602 RepID=A0A9D3UC11_9ROSI|nr:hypothetical protein J1N35_045950 [Gossypium stocksii]